RIMRRAMGTSAIKSFEKRFAKIQHTTDPAGAVGAYTPEEVTAWIRAKAEQDTDFGYPYRDALRVFPREWWSDAVAELVRSRHQGCGARAFVEALFNLDPDSFADARRRRRRPRHRRLWRLRTCRTLERPELGLEAR